MIIFLIAIGLSFCASASNIKIGIYDGQKITAASLHINQGAYVIDLTNSRPEVSSTQRVQLSVSQNKLNVKVNGRDLGKHTEFILVATAPNSEFTLTPTKPAKKAQRYHDNLIVKVRNGVLVFINETNLDKYVSGVVEAETGAQHTKEFYKVQAIISRTYALSNKHKHASQGFHLCDKVHCQVFHGKARYNDEILFAAYETADIVLVDSDIQLITAAFHSNCGGQTINSDKVWSQSLPYLQSVPDTFCLAMSQSNWEKRIPKSDWTAYLQKKNIRMPADSVGNALAYSTGTGQEHFLDNESLRLVDVRKDWKLRSARFTLTEEGNEVVFMGKGFGHGVGLCQEGAIRRAELGHSYREILSYYYQHVHLINLEQLEFFRDN